MNEPNIFITQRDLDRLEELIGAARKAGTLDTDYLDRLEDALVSKTSVGSRAVPADVITMNSRVLLRDPRSGEELDYTLTFPADADAGAGRISVLAPLGTAMLGARSGQAINWAAGGFTHELTVANIRYQPEAAGDFHL